MRFRWRSGIACYARARRPGIGHGYRRARPLSARSPGSVPFHEIRDHRHWKSSVERLQHAKSKAGSLSCLRTTHQDDQHIIHEVSSAIPSESLSSARAWLALPVPRCTARPKTCIYPGSPKSGWSRPAGQGRVRAGRCRSLRFQTPWFLPAVHRRADCIGVAGAPAPPGRGRSGRTGHRGKTPALRVRCACTATARRPRAPRRGPWPGQAFSAWRACHGRPRVPG